MRNMKYVVLSATLLLACAGSAQASGELVLGDSLGVGVKAVSGRTGPARLSQFIRNDQILTQLATVPSGATAFLVLGTNDSAGSVKGLEKNIDNIVQAADARNIKLIWVGPPCVRKAWDGNSKALDAMLSARLASTSVKYISIRSDEALCSGQYTGGDGVHLNFAGYSIMWNKARLAAGLPDSEDKPVKIATRKPKPRAEQDFSPLGSFFSFFRRGY
jgi:lysophospholipase L1-like esterase